MARDSQKGLLGALGIPGESKKGTSRNPRDLEDPKKGRIGTSGIVRASTKGRILFLTSTAAIVPQSGPSRQLAKC